MKHKWTMLLLIGAVIVSLALSACGGGGSGGGTVGGDGSSGSSGVTIPPINSDPIANAGPDQNVTTWSTVTLDGSGSSDPDGDLLTFLWIFTSKPDGSAATLSDPTAVNPTFIADYDGEYVLHLTVHDGLISIISEPVTITASTTNSAPIANAGPDQNVILGSIVTLDGSASMDADGDTLAYSWVLTTLPSGSTATLSNPAIVNPTFVVDIEGTYVLTLSVDDGELVSQSDSVIINTVPPIEVKWLINNNGLVITNPCSVSGTFYLGDGYRFDFNNCDIYGYAGNVLKATIINNTDNYYTISTITTIFYDIYVPYTYNISEDSKVLEPKSYSSFSLPMPQNFKITDSKAIFSLVEVGDVESRFQMIFDQW